VFKVKEDMEKVVRISHGKKAPAEGITIIRLRKFAG
jgi:hypothetical protein